MHQLPLNPADLVVIAVILGVVALVVRGMLRGSIRTCDSASCGGDCGGCVGSCSNPRIRLTRAQLDELDALTERAREAKS